MSDDESWDYTADFEKVICCSYGIPFCMTDDLHAQRQKDGDTFYCPNGHSQMFTTGTEKVAEQELAKAREEIRQKSKQLTEAKTAAIKADLKQQTANRRLCRVIRCLHILPFR